MLAKHCLHDKMLKMLKYVHEFYLQTKERKNLKNLCDYVAKWLKSVDETTKMYLIACVFCTNIKHKMSAH